MMMKNKVAATFILTFLVTAGLIALYFFPPVKLGKDSLRKVDILADMRPEIIEVPDSDTVVSLVPVKPVFIDSCKTGMVCIEDYSDSTGRGMDHFYKALSDLEILDRPVRIAYFGDSFIEGDIFTGDLRKMLQQKFGGSGVGYVPMASNVAGFRTTVKHTFGGWGSHCVTDTSYFDRSRQDISNHYFVPRWGAYLSLKAVSGDSCQSSTVYFQSTDSVFLSAYINGSQEPFQFPLKGDSLLQSVTVHGSIREIRWQVDRTDSVSTFYAATMDPVQGIIVDNFSTRGSSGIQLKGIPMSVLCSYNRMRPYDLIVLQYGLNVASDEVTNYSYYKETMNTVVRRLKTAFPNTSILIVGVGDRDEKTETGELRTMRGVKNLIRYQQALAAESHVAFWNLFDAMGGEGSMAEMVHSKPSMANYDYTHINSRGGRHLAKILYDVLLYGKEQYEKRKAYEKD